MFLKAKNLFFSVFGGIFQIKGFKGFGYLSTN